MRHFLSLLVAIFLVACDSPSGQAPPQQPDLSTAPEQKPEVGTQSKQEPEVPAQAPPIMKVGKVSVMGALDEDVIRSHVRPKLAEIQHCYEAGLVKPPSQSGEVLVNFQIGPSGWVLAAILKGYDADNCVSTVFKSIQLPKAKDGGYVNVKYWFTIQLEREPDVPKSVVAYVLDLDAMERNLKKLTIREPVTKGYKPKDWKHWTDEDKDCQDTRQEVLIEESEVAVTFKTERMCKVLTGRWTCPYTGEVFTDPSKLEVDHLVPLAAAHAAGGHGWDAARKRAFANNLDAPHHLIAVKASAHRSKGNQTPETWLPENESYGCAYLQSWLAIKTLWKLSASEDEEMDISAAVDDCRAHILDPECAESNDPMCGLED